MSSHSPEQRSAGQGDWLAGKGSWLTTFLVPLFLISACPPVAVFLWMIIVHYDGSVIAAVTSPPGELIGHIPAPSLPAAAMLLGWLLLQYLLLRLLPGKTHLGTVTPKGNRPSYRLNGVAAFIVTHALWLLATEVLHLFPGAVVYHHFGSLLITASALALAFCGYLYLKGLRAPSSSDAGGTGNPLWDYWWGTELHPKLAGVEIKQLFNCRFAMMGWSIILFSYAAAQIELHGSLSTSMMVCVGLQVVYIFKFFWWEGGYFNSLDIMHDRFGFYICWGVCAWLPIVYTIHGLYLVDHPYSLSLPYTVGLFAFGLLAIRINYAADEQRVRVRASNGDTLIWGRKPETILATYVPADGEPRQNLLLVSGWWGVARHFHYLPELLLALAWTLPVGFNHILPWFYLIFLTILLVHRSLRDDERCAAKYGEFWEQYRRRVRWRILPGVF